MAKDKKEKKHAVVAPLLGAGVLGTGAYGSHKLDRLLNDIGLGSHLRVNPEAVEAINAYANLRPDSLDPTTFARQYAEAAHEASSAQLFLNDPRKVWEWEINNPELREKAYAKAQKAQEVLDRLADKSTAWATRFRNKSFNRPARLLDRLSSLLRGASGRLNTLGPLERNRGDKALLIYGKGLAHTPEMGQSPLRSYIRLLNEMGPEVRTDRVVDHTLEALLNFRNPTYGEFLGKSFSSPAEYFNAIQQYGYKKKMPHLFDKYMSSFDEIVREHGNNSSELAAQVRKAIAPNYWKELPAKTRKLGIDPYRKIGKDAIGRELRHLIGGTSSWKWDPEKGILSLEQAIKPGSKGIRTIQDIVDMAESSPALKFLNAKAALNYGRTSIGYGKFFNKLNLLLKLRSNKTKLGLGLGALGLGGLAASNMVRNMRKKHFWEH